MNYQYFYTFKDCEICLLLILVDRSFVFLLFPVGDEVEDLFETIILLLFHAGFMVVVKEYKMRRVSVYDLIKNNLRLDLVGFIVGDFTPD